LLTWDAPGDRIFETGIDRGVLYVEGQPGVSWNGLTDVAENPTGGEVKARYIDGVKYLATTSAEEFGVTITAFTYPDEFAQCDGTAIKFAGVYFGQQTRKPFGLSYRTRIGNDAEGVDHGYKIHLVYGALATPSERSYSTMTENTDPSTFSWACLATPSPVGNGLKPTAHITIDSRKIPAQALQILESRLYGSELQQPYLPTPAELFQLFTINPGMAYRLQFNSVTGLSMLVPEVPGDLVETTTAGIFALTETTHLTGGSVDGTYIWEP